MNRNDNNYHHHHHHHLDIVSLVEFANEIVSVIGRRPVRRNHKMRHENGVLSENSITGAVLFKLHIFATVTVK